MSTLNSSLAAPSRVYMGWTVTQTGENDMGSYCIYEDGNTYFYVAWESKYKTYQIRWRRRQRKRPTSTVAGDWGGWGAWQGAGSCSTSTARGTLVTPSDTQNWDTWNMANARPSASTNLFGANQATYTHYAQITAVAMGTYDMEQWQVQVRPYDEGAKKHGNAKTVTLAVIHEPNAFSVTAVKLANSDGLHVFYTTDWNRDGNMVRVTWPNGTFHDIDGVKGGLTGTSFYIPPAKMNKDYDVGDTISAKFDLTNTADAGGDIGAYRRATYSGTVQSQWGVESAAPSIGLAADPASHVMTVTVSGGSAGYPWTSATAWATWYEPDGTKKTVSPTRVVSENLSGMKGVYEFANVPSDVDVKYCAKVVSVANDNKASGYSRTAKLKSLGRAFLTIGDKTAALICGYEEEAGITWSRSYAPNVETEVCAGRSREVSRHGIGGAASIQVHGDIVYDTEHHDMGDGNRLTDWEAMKSKTGSDGIICLPQGIYAKVAVLAIDIDTTRPTHSVSLELEEVE